MKSINCPTVGQFIVEEFGAGFSLVSGCNCSFASLLQYMRVMFTHRHEGTRVPLITMNLTWLDVINPAMQDDIASRHSGGYSRMGLQML